MARKVMLYELGWWLRDKWLDFVEWLREYIDFGSDDDDDLRYT